MMGTSSSNTGTGSEKPLVPSFLDESEDTSDNENETSQPTAIEPQRFRSARYHFSRFAGSGGSNSTALKRAVSDYVRTGTRGSRNAVRRMAPSLRVAQRALVLFRSLQQDGFQETLRRLSLQKLSGLSIRDIFTRLTEVICDDGGTIDDAIARDAWLETVAEIDKFGIDTLDTLTDLQIQEVFLSFVANSIVVRLYQEIGVNGFKQSVNLNEIEKFDEQFRDLIVRSVRDSFADDILTRNMSDEGIKKVVDSTFDDAWSFLQLLGEQEE